MKKISVSVVIPCLNEEKAVGKCVVNARKVLVRLRVTGRRPEGSARPGYGLRVNYEIIVVDNGSGDKSVEVARKAGARVIHESRKGYGFALRRGIREARGEIIVMGDADGSYDFSEIPKLISKLLKGYDLVIGSRLTGKIAKNAMPFWHRHLGTPAINFLFRRFYKINLSDTQSGFRVFWRKKTEKLNFTTGGMDFASEMIFKAIRQGWKIGEVPINYYPRIGVSKLSVLRDGWLHFKFLLLFSPSYLFLTPGTFLFFFGITMTTVLSFGPLYAFKRSLDVHSMLVFSFVSILGFQIIFLGLFAKTYAYLFLQEKDMLYQKLLERFTLEKGILIGGGFFLCGLAIFLNIFYIWAKGGFGALAEIRMLILSMTLIIIGLQGVFSSFFFALLGSGEAKN